MGEPFACIDQDVKPSNMRATMKYLFSIKHLLLLVCLGLVSICGFPQNSKIQKAIENSLNYDHMFIDNEGNSFIVKYRVDNCNFDEEDFNKFRNSTSSYYFSNISINNVYRFGDYYDFVGGFTVSLRNQSGDPLERAIRVANKNNSLKLPNFLNLDETYQFYTTYVKKYSRISRECWQEFSKRTLDAIQKNAENYVKFLKGAPYKHTDFLNGKKNWELMEFLKKNPSGIVTFCKGSPYKNDQFLKDIDILYFLENNLSDNTYVYLKNANEGYIVNREGCYTGGILNNQMHGKGKHELGVAHIGFVFDERIVRETYEGEFKNGMRNGSMTHHWYNNSYKGTNGRTYTYSETKYFRMSESGKCVNDKWNGQTKLRVAHDYKEDVWQCNYSKGNLLSKTPISIKLTNYLQNNNLTESQFFSLRIPKIKKKYEEKNSDRTYYRIHYEDGTYIGQAYYYKNGELKCDGAGNLKIRNGDEAARYAYLWYTYDNAYELCMKYGIPGWAN